MSKSTKPLGEWDLWPLLAFAAVAVIFGLGLWRLLDDPKSTRTLAAHDAAGLSECLPVREIPLGTTVTLVQANSVATPVTKRVTASRRHRPGAARRCTRVVAGRGRLV